MPRLHHRDAVGHRLEQEQSLRLLVGRGHREDVDALEERHLLRAIDFTAVVELLLEPPFPHLAPDLVEVWLVLGAR